MQLLAEDQSRDPRCLRPQEQARCWFKARKRGGGEARLVVSGVVTMVQPTGDIYSGNTKAV